MAKKAAKKAVKKTAKKTAKKSTPIIETNNENVSKFLENFPADYRIADAIIIAEDLLESLQQIAEVHGEDLIFGDCEIEYTNPYEDEDDEDE